ncbi:MAG TPA: TetR/AcrR family transcriptional regulator [Candidatus Limnocylindrales bacterium]
MPRTLNPETYALRRDAFVDAAQRLIQTKGYQQFSVQDVLDELDASKGAFYHYFDSKAALLDAVIDQMADAAAARLEPVLANPNLSAAQKVDALFNGLAQFKAEQKELVLAILRVWLSDDNTIVRETYRRLVTARMVPWLDAIVRQGIAEGKFSATFPGLVTRVLASLIQGTSELAGELWVARQTDSVSFKEVEDTFAAYREAFERIVGAQPGTLTLVDGPTLRFWFG